MQETLSALESRLPGCLRADRGELARRLAGLERRIRRGQPVDRGLKSLVEAIEASTARRARRLAGLPAPSYPEALPVSTRREAIAEAITAHQVVVIAGETGSGKTTQIPKICLELGRGVDGLIGHTQPRRLAARSVAARIAEELNSPLGALVGYKVRFTDRSTPDSYIRLMTDGILLAEVRSDPLLSQYDTIIIDEAHERSLNIDFLLGYLKRLLPKRPDLKLIVTSATINTEAFSAFFGGAPVIEVSGRTYPVEVRYRPLAGEDEDDRDREEPEAIVEAVDELGRVDPLGDVLVFLPGEREIRDAAEALRQHKLRETEILPLFSRLSAAEQDRIFQPHPGRRIVLATNVAETSLTVPGIRFVVDTGLARISRYSHRTKVQRLPVEAISQASANQRAGRCGRVSAGVCIRLYGETDLLGRPEFTDPEILRTNLASVILQMLVMRLGEIEAFPFLTPPDRRHINDGYRLLHELGAVDAGRRITEVGRRLARLPVDPRIGRMLLAAGVERSLHEVLIIASALSVQDPRERPLEAQQAADLAHGEFRDERSDFLGFLKLWEWYHEQARHLSTRKLRTACRERFISYVRMREWHDIHGQLLALARELELTPNSEPADYRAVHRALLTGLLGNIAFKDEKQEYLGARAVRLSLFPGSALFARKPKWIVAAELVETSRLYARTAAIIEPEWLEPLAGHLVKKNWSDPHWEKRAGRVTASERVTLYGLIIVPGRRVDYGPIDPKLSRELFIHHALIEGALNTRAPFLAHNRALVAEVEALEAKSRRRDVLVETQALFDFYDARLPEGLCSGKRFERWRVEAERENPRQLFLTRDDLMRHGADEVTGERFPDHLHMRGMRLPVEYHFEPGHPADGVTVVVPLAAVGQLEPGRFDWLVPGLIEEKIIALIKSLPKAMRRNFVPAVNFARALLDVIKPGDAPLISNLTRELRRMTGVEIPPEAWDTGALPPHLTMNFRVVDASGAVLAEGRDLAILQTQLAGRVRQSLSLLPHAAIERDAVAEWDFGELPERVEVEQGGVTLCAWPTLVEQGGGVALRLLESEELAAERMHAGMRRLFMLNAGDKLKYLKKNLPGAQHLCLLFAPIGGCEALKEDIVLAACDRAFLGGKPLPRTPEAFTERLAIGRQTVVEAGSAVAGIVGRILEVHRELAPLLKGNIAPHRLLAVADVRDQIGHLIYPGFVAATPADRLADLPRYLNAARLRLEKLDRALDRDRANFQAIAPLWRGWLARAEAVCAENRTPSEGLTAFRWQLEELRVSLFAQELGTREPVSVPRLEKAWRTLANGR